MTKILSDQIKGFMANSSFIRKMFENGIELKKKYGVENVFDFSLGNPDVAPPTRLKKVLHEIADDIEKPFSLGYMPNAGYPHVRDAVAEKISKEQNVEVPSKNLVLTCGAAGGMNALFRAVLNPGDEVVVPAPYFVEYGFYASNFGGKLIPVKTTEMTFDLDFDLLSAAINEKTRAFIVNSPNNPTGKVYTAETYQKLGELLRTKSAEYGRPIYLVSDEPYRFLHYAKESLPSVFNYYENSVVISSYSKSLSMAGARIGYIAINPKMVDHEELLQGVVMTNRILGFVNAPALAQKILPDSLYNEVETDIYHTRRDAMADVLDSCGIEYSMPEGAFYFFPKSPLADDKEFCAKLMEENILAVPGSGFGYPGYFRMAFCVNKETIEKSKAAFQRVMAKLR